MPGAGASKTGEVNVRTGDIPIRRTAEVSTPPKPTGDVSVPPMRPRAPSVGNSRPPPPLPSSITQRGKQPSLSDLADAQKTDKDKK